MTINVVSVCRDALILGCDSVASSTKAVIEPWRPVERMPTGIRLWTTKGGSLLSLMLQIANGLPPTCGVALITEIDCGRRTQRYSLSCR